MSKYFQFFINFGLIIFFFILKKNNSNFFLKYFNFFSYKLLSSNHPRRFETFYLRFKSILFWVKGNEIWQKKNKKKENIFFFLNSKIISSKNVEIIFLGDSHVEFFSRILECNYSIIPKRIKAFWLGPKTVIGLIGSSEISEINKNLKFITKSNSCKKYIILSLGSIDIRTSFYELMLRKIVKNDKELINIFERGLNILLSNVMNNNSKKLLGIGFLELMDSYELGAIPKSIKELEIIKNNSLYPTFGSIAQRTKWTNKINAIIKKKVIKNNIDFIEIKSSFKDKKNKDVLFDKIHLSSNKIIKKIYSTIQNNIKMKINL